MTLDPSWFIPLLTFAGAIGGAKVALNGTKERVKNMDEKIDAGFAKQAEKLDKHIEQDNNVQTILLTSQARIEAKLDTWNRGLT